MGEAGLPRPGVGSRCSGRFNGGSRLGHYDVTVLIGAGGVGEMYRARDTLLDRDGALKVPAPAFSDDTRLNPDEFQIRT